MRTQTNGESANNSTVRPEAVQFVEEHHASLAGAIDHLLWRTTEDPELMRSEEFVRSYRMLFTFRRILHPTPEVDY